MKVTFTLKIIIMLLLFSRFPGQAAAVPINIAVPASGEGIKKLLSWTPLIQYIEEETGQEINLNIVRDHKTIREELEQKNYDFALINPFWYVLWKNDDFCLPFLVSTGNEPEGIRSILIVHSNSIFRTVEDLKNYNIALTVPYDSASGFYIPLAIMYNHGIDSFSYFKALVFPETFESILKGVAYGKLESGFITSDILNEKGNSRYRDDIRIIIESEVLPGPIIVVRNDFNQELANIIRNSMIHLKDRVNGMTLLRSIGISDFKQPDEGAFRVVRDYLRVLDLHDASPE